MAVANDRFIGRVSHNTCSIVCAADVYILHGEVLDSAIHYRAEETGDTVISNAVASGGEVADGVAIAIEDAIKRLTGIGRQVSDGQPVGFAAQVKVGREQHLIISVLISSVYSVAESLQLLHRANLDGLNVVARLVDHVVVDSDGVAVNSSRLDVIDLNQGAVDNQASTQRGCARELSFVIHFTVLNCDSIVKSCYTSRLHIQGSLRYLSVVDERATFYQYRETFLSALTIDIEKFTLAVVGKSTVVIVVCAIIVPHVVISIILHKVTVGEVHVSVGKKLSVECAAFHVNGSRVLETMIISVTKGERNVLERYTIRNRCNIVTCRMAKHHTVDTAIDGNVLRNARQCVGTCGNDVDGLTCC